jgi:hypothetical protein
MAEAVDVLQHEVEAGVWTRARASPAAAARRCARRLMRAEARMVALRAMRVGDCALPLALVPGLQPHEGAADILVAVEAGDHHSR